MTHRGRTILKLLSESTSRYTTVERIAEETGAGMRTIHRDLEGLERSLRLRGVRMERRRGFGIRLIDPLPNILLEGIRDTRPSGGVDSGQRPMMVLLYLIIAGDWVKLADIASVLFVTDSTISNDLSVLESWLPEGMVLERHRGLGIRIISEELPLRLLFLSSFPAIFPMYVINSEASPSAAEASGEERFLRFLDVRAKRDAINGKIAIAEEILGYQFSPVSRGLLFAYLYLLVRHLPLGRCLERLPSFRLEVPETFGESAIAMIASDLANATDSAAVTAAEIEVLSRLISSCETTAPPASSVAEFIGSLSPRVETMLENSLSRLEEKEKVWLHDDRILLNYFRMTIVAAARRIDLGLSQWWELGLRPLPGIEDTPVSVVLVSQFLSDFGRMLREPPPAIVRREIHEVSLAVEARLEAFRSRITSPLRIKILCYEGLGMSNYVLALSRDAFPAGTVFNNIWEANFDRSGHADQYDLIITTFPLPSCGSPILFIKGDDTPERIRHMMKEAVKEIRADGAVPPARTPAAEADETRFDREGTFSLSEVMSVIEGFFVVTMSRGDDPIDLAVGALSGQGEDATTMREDFQRRESYGSLIFEEMNIRILHCRTDGVSEPHAGVIQDAAGGETTLVLAAPVTAKQLETHALSEIVIALTEYEDFPEILATGSRREIQARLMTLFGSKAG